MSEKEYQTLLDGITSIASQFNSSINQVYPIYKNMIDVIVSTCSKNAQEIERTLDGMLDFCFDSKVLLQYKRLCRYYYEINPINTAFYINSYREMWDSDDNEGHTDNSQEFQ